MFFFCGRWPGLSLGLLSLPNVVSIVPPFSYFDQFCMSESETLVSKGITAIGLQFVSAEEKLVYACVQIGVLIQVCTQFCIHSCAQRHSSMINDRYK